MFKAPLGSISDRSSLGAYGPIRRLVFLAATTSSLIALLLLSVKIGGAELSLNSYLPVRKPGTAICIFLSGSAVGLSLLGRHRATTFVGLIVAFIAFGRLLELVFVEIPSVRLLSSGYFEVALEPFSRIGPNTALGFLLVGLGLTFANSKRRGLRVLSQILALTALLVSLFAIIGHAYGLDELRGLGSFIPMALDTAVALSAISAAIVALTPADGLMVLLRDEGPAGSMIRTVLPLAVGVPVALGGARLWGQSAGYYGNEVGIALQVVGNIALTTSLLTGTLFGLYRKDRIRSTREQSLARAAQTAEWNATHDRLTGLQNRSSFLSALERRTDSRFSVHFAVLLIDVDDFGRINDTLGHEAGDATLRTVAAGLRRALRPEDIIARLGDDEFAVILTGAGSRPAIQSAADMIFANLSKPWEIDGHLMGLRVSIGATLCASPSSVGTELLNDAEVALQSAKLNRQDPFEIFRPSMRVEIESRTAQLALARQALAADRIVPFYQPKVNLKSGQHVGFEALLRCRTEQGLHRTPDVIAAAFEEFELSERLTDRMLSLCISDMRNWMERGIDFGHVAVNASAADFKRGDFAEMILARLEAGRVPARFFQLEVTETVFLGRGADHVARALRLLSRRGVRIALDDFGTGYASLTHLKQFPVDVVKIDRSFVGDGLDKENSAIIRTVASLGRALDLEIVAEGVETDAQRAYLTAHGCTTGQGYLFGRPGPARGVPEIIRSRGAVRANPSAGNEWRASSNQMHH